jgi:hypothetical protein
MGKRQLARVLQSCQARRLRIQAARHAAAARSDAPTTWCAEVMATSMAVIVSPSGRAPLGTTMNAEIRDPQEHLEDQDVHDHEAAAVKGGLLAVPAPGADTAQEHQYDDHQ